jgi:hypothetical protein
MSNGVSPVVAVAAMAAASFLGVGLALAQNPAESVQPLPALHAYTVNTNGPATIMVIRDDPKPDSVVSPGGLVKVDRASSVVVIVRVEAPKYATCWIRDETAGRIGENISPEGQEDGAVAMCHLKAGDPQ